MCVANSARSQMAEGLARAVAPAGVEIFSAGSAPATVNPHAVEAMKGLGIDITSHHSKSVDDIPKERIGTVITLCAEEVCPAYLGDAVRVHWPHEDPAAADEAEIAESFRRVRDQIKAKVDAYFAR